MTKQLTPDEVASWRQETGLSQEKFGDMLDVSRSTIVRIETGETPAPKWMSLSRDGWRASNGPTDLESIIRRIVRDEIAKGGER